MRRFYRKNSIRLKTRYNASMHDCLSNCRVLDLSRVLAGPLCAMQLADFGATVIKVENPDGGDETRHWGPPFNERSGLSAYFETANRGKKSAAINFSKPEGAKAVRRLAQNADVLVENYRPGGLKKYGLDYDSIHAINPGLVYCSITGYGQTGEWSERPGYDFIIQGESGLMALGGETDGTPAKTGVAVCDVWAGLHASQAILAALLRRANTGKGAHIDISLFDCAVATLVNVAQSALCAGRRAKRYGNHHPQIVPYGDFFASDESFNLAAGNDRQFAAVCAIIGREEWASDKRFCDNPSRVKNREELIPMLNAEFGREKAEHWLRLFHRDNVPAGRTLNVYDALNTPHALSRGLWKEGEAGKMLSAPARFDGGFCASAESSPRLGSHTAWALRELGGMSDDDIESLRRQNIIKEAL